MYHFETEDMRQTTVLVGGQASHTDEKKRLAGTGTYRTRTPADRPRPNDAGVPDLRNYC